MTDARPVGVVVDTMVISWLFDQRPNPVADRYRALIETRPVLLAFQTVMELRYGGLARWLGRVTPPAAGTTYRRAHRRPT